MHLGQNDSLGEYCGPHTASYCLLLVLNLRFTTFDLHGHLAVGTYSVPKPPLTHISGRFRALGEGGGGLRVRGHELLNICSPHGWSSSWVSPGTGLPQRRGTGKTWQSKWSWKNHETLAKKSWNFMTSRGVLTILSANSSTCVLFLLILRNLLLIQKVHIFLTFPQNAANANAKFEQRDGHGKSRNGHGKVMEQILQGLWEPCRECR